MTKDLYNKTRNVGEWTLILEKVKYGKKKQSFTNFQTIY